jgi:RNA polymerase sigma-70 factor (ECF subfamily)
MEVNVPDRRDLQEIRLTTAAAVSEDAQLLAAERRLVRACRQGDAAAMRTLIERFQSDVYRICCRLLGDEHEAEDIAQEAFLRVFRSLHTWDQARPLRPWILSIAMNRCRTLLAKRAKRPALTALLDINPSKDAAPERTHELRQEIDQVVEELRDEYREVFLLFHTEELPYEMIGRILDKPVGTIKTWLHRARLAIVQRLQERGLGCEG